MKTVRVQTAGARRVVYLLGPFLGVLLLALPMFSQANFGRILGTVTDQSGGVISGATVTITDKDRGVARTLTTDEAGEYNAPTLIPGTYSVRVEAKGFRTLDRQNIVLEVGKEVRVDLTPLPGEQAQTVTVTESLPLVETTNAVLGGTLNNADINDMPLNGRNYQNLLSLRPGVMIQPGGSPWTQSTNNIRPDETAWMVDGVINANFNDARPVANMPSPLTDGATILPIDAIQEFNLEENPKAEYGWKPGAVVNVGIRSGTNTFHGSAYGFYRSGAWAARNVFNPAPVNGNCALGALALCAQLPTQLKQFGGVVGGPVKKDKLFFFVGYEGLRSFVGNAYSTNVPATGSGLGPKKSMPDAIKALQAAGVPLSPVSMSLLGCTPAPVACTGNLIQNAPVNTTGYLSSFPNTNVSDNGIAKVDYRINSEHMITGMVWNGSYTGNGEDHAQVSQRFAIPIPITTRTAIGNWIWTPSSRVVNQASFGYNYVYFYQGTGDSNVLADGKGYPINTGIRDPGGLPNISISPFTYIGTWPNRPGGFSDPYYDFEDTVSYLRGKHAFKFGGGFTRIEVDTIAGNTSRGRIDFLGGNTAGLTDCTDSSGAKISCPLEDFFAGNPSRGFLLAGNRFRTATSRAYNGFLQDDWRLTPKLMVNLGLRYSYVSPYKEINGLYGNFDPALGMVQQGQPSVGDSIVKPDRKNFSPRLGFAWDLNGKGTTVLRGGASVIYSTIPAGVFTTQLGLQDSTSTNIAADPTGACTTKVVIGVPCPKTFGGSIQLASASFTPANLNWNGVVFPNGAGLSCTAQVPCNLLAIDPNLKAPYMVNWDFGVQHAFTNNLSLEVSYVGNRGERLILFRDINQIPPSSITPATPKGVRPFVAQLDAQGTPMSYLKFINQASNGAHSNYHSLQATLTKRLSHGLSFLAGYTYGHGLDNGSLNRYGTLPQNSLNPGAEYASSDFDVRHRFTFTTTYDIPGIKGFGQLLEGWKLNSIVNLQTSQPWMAFDAGDNFSGSGDNSDRWDFFGNPGDFGSGANSIPFCIPDPKTGVIGCSQTSGVTSAAFCGTTAGACDATTTAAMWAKCTAVAPSAGTLAAAGCYVSGNSVLVPPAKNTFGNMGRNIFRDSGFKNVDFSVFKNFSFKERYNAQFRVELFNLFNHPIIANPYGASTGYGGASGGTNDMSTPSTFGCGCATPDVAAGNPLVGSGSSRVMQLGLKLTF